MAEFVAPQFQNPDILGGYIRGQMARQQQQMFPLQMQAAQQENVAGGLKIDQLRMALQSQKAIQGVALQQLQGQGYNIGGAPGPGGAQNVGTASGGIQNGPQGMPAQSSISLPGMDPHTAYAVELLRGGDPLAAQERARTDAIERAKITLAPMIAQAKNIITSPDPGRLLMNNPSYMQTWQQYAPKLGFDPSDVKALTPDNIRMAATMAHNDMVSQYGGEALPMPVKSEQIRGPNGQLLSRNPITGEVKQEVAEESLHQVIDPKTGQPVLLPASQAAGKTPFNQSIFGAANMSDQAIQFAADTYRTTGKMPASLGRNPAMQAKILERVAQDAQASGDSTGAIAARTAALKANGQALDQVTKLESATTSFASTLDKNLDSLMQIKGKVDSSGVPILNKVYRAYQQGVSGDPEVAKYVTMLNAVEGEYAKINSGSLGNAPTSDAAKRDAKDVINKFMTSGQVDAVAQTMRQETQNRLSSIREQKQSLMGGLGQSAPGSQQSTTYKSADDVKAAFKSGKLTRDQAKQILGSQFGMK